VVSNIFTVILKEDVNLRKGKMALLPYRQNINANHIRSCFTQIKLKVKGEIIPVTGRGSP
jgi:hypothetical protein